jgi:hypothetical protein
MASRSRQDESNSLRRFGECAVAMRNILQQDGGIGEAEFAFMDNHFQVLEMAYFRWKQKQTSHISVAGSGSVRSKTA